MLKFIKRPAIIITFIILIFGGGGYWQYRRGKQIVYEFVSAAKRDLVQTVSVTGHVKPAETIDLSFEIGGKVDYLAVDTGDNVRAGQTVGELASADLRANLIQLEAAVASARASLAALQRGTRPEEIQVAAIAVSNAKKALIDAKTNLENAKQQADVALANLYADVPDVLNSAATIAGDAVNKPVQEMFTSETWSRLAFVVADTQAQVDVENQRAVVSTTLTTFRHDLDTLPTGAVSRDAELTKAVGYMTTVRSFLSRLTDVLNSSTSLSTATSAAYKTDVNTGRTNVNASIASIGKQQQSIASARVQNQVNVAAAESKVTDAENALATAEANLKLKQAAATKEDIDGAEAAVKQAEANVASAEVKLNRTVLRVPIDGVITKRNVEVGENIAANVPMFSMITRNHVEIEANVPEVDIGKLAVGNAVSVTLDAFPGETFAGKVSYIDPAETIVEGVVNFRVKVALEKDDPRFKSGLTANLSIETQRKNGVLALPQFAIVENDQGTFVRTLTDGKTQDSPVTLGIRSQDGYVEVMSGVSDGESVLNVGAKSTSPK